MKKLMILFVAFLLVMAAGISLDGAVWAPQMMKHMRYGIHLAEKNLFSGRMLLRMKDDIGLTQDQVDKIEQLQDAHREGMIKRNADIQLLEVKFQSLLKEEQVNRAGLEKIIRDIAKMRTDMQIEHINHLLDLRDLLLPDQLTKIDEIKREMRQKRLDRRHDRRGRRFTRRDRER